MTPLLRSLAAAASLAVLSGCATTSPNDPIEPLNRGIYHFNTAVDNVVLKPAAHAYDQWLPSPVQSGVHNFFSNLDDIIVVFNDLLQAKFQQALEDLARFGFNSTIGLAGLIDVATTFDLPKHNEDFGQTLGYWGLGDGPYLVLPFLGPSSVRDGVGRLVDHPLDVVWDVDHVPTRNTLVFTRGVEQRASLLPADKVVEEAALDKYTYIREAYLQRRRSLVYDGSPPKLKEE